MTGVFLDRRILLDDLLRWGTAGAVPLSTRLGDYDTVAYEASGISGLEYALDYIVELRGKLAGIRPSELTLDPAEEKLFAQTLAIAAKTPAISWAAIKYQQSARSQADPMDAVSYTLRLLNAARTGGFDLGVHQDRLPIVRELFTASGVTLEAAGDNVLVSEPCGFPHLPQPVPGTTVYHVIGLGGDRRDDTAAVAHPTAPPTPAGKRIFIAYSHRDQAWLDRLLEVLTPSVRTRDIDIWSDRRITSGQTWRDEIERALATADAGVMLVSASFLASDFVTRHEIPALLERHRAEQISITWIAVSASLYKYTPIERFQALNDPKRPLAELSAARRQRELVNIAENIRGMLAGRA
jgi:TIR domain